ncbi:MAG: SemiSWEET transporter [Terracidiphilus sp.]|nr:SemiSWEET transporter [Terracidiphilus sp.]
MVDRWITETIGMAAGICTTTSLAPQLVRIWKTKSARDLSLAMFLVFGVGVALWIAYGITANSPSVILTNSCSMVLVVSILTLAVRYNRRNRENEE